ncbi:MAG: hypothetical protein HC886_09135 [Leptolyngbyaceae cyanobacterium SM1_1_3]|nr:hypothetical protein [Leptolyngbyaceae cyanobacterium SM1_1_3]
MTSQTIDSGVIATFNNRQEAVKAKEAIVAAGISSQKVVIDGYTKPRAQVAALGTTAGGAAGIWLGLGYGGVIGIIVAAVLSFSTAAPSTTLL